MAEKRKHEIIEINKMEDLSSSYFIRRGIIYSRDCDNNCLNVWIEGTLFENLEIFYHCENETEFTPDKAFDLFEVGRKVLVLHKFIYHEENGKKTEKIEKIERTVIGLKYNVPEGISNLQPCVVKRFFTKIKKVIENPVTGDSVIVYSYYWVYINDEEDERKITVIEISDNEDRTETEVFLGIGFFSELEKVLYLGDPLLNPLTHSATKSFMMTNDKNFRERWVATPCSLFKDQCEVINVVPLGWTPPPPCDLEELPCPPNRFYCNIEKRILVWYGAYEIFIGAAIVKFNTDTNYTRKNVAASGASIGAIGYHTVPGTQNDIPINMMSDVKSVSNTEISFYLPHIQTFDRPGLVTINWIDYEWGATISAVGVEETEHWYWSENGFEQKACAHFTQEIAEIGETDEVDVYEMSPGEDFDCESLPWTTNPDFPECAAHRIPWQHDGKVELTIATYGGYVSDYSITLFEELFFAKTTARDKHTDEFKAVGCKFCIIEKLPPPYSEYKCVTYTTQFGCCADRVIDDTLSQKESTGLSANWLSPNVAYYYKNQDRRRCIAVAEQAGNVYGKITGQTGYWGGASIEKFANSYWWPATPYGNPQACTNYYGSASIGTGNSFRYDMPGPERDWLTIDRDECEYLGHSPLYGDHYKWIRDANLNEFLTPLLRKFKLDDIEFDATKIYKTYYLDDRATCHEQGLIIAGKGVRDSEIFWEVYHDGTDITEKLFEALDCEQSELDEIGLI